MRSMCERRRTKWSFVLNSLIMPLLGVKNLRTFFHTRNGVVRAVNGVSFAIEKGETLGSVAESGSGKSVTGYSLLRLIPQPPGTIESGQAMFDGVDLLSCPRNALQKIRGKSISMIFQDPMTSLNPYLRIGDQLIEPLLIHDRMERGVAMALAIEMLQQVGIQDAATRVQCHPYKFSGAIPHRVMLPMD